jgi:hypothetical protein
MRLLIYSTIIGLLCCTSGRVCLTSLGQQPIRHEILIAGGFTGIIDEEGREVWSTEPNAKDAVRLNDGHILVTWTDKVVEFDNNKQECWRMEIILRHTCSGIRSASTHPMELSLPTFKPTPNILVVPTKRTGPSQRFAWKTATPLSDALTEIALSNSIGKAKSSGKLPTMIWAESSRTRVACSGSPTAIP